MPTAVRAASAGGHRTDRSLLAGDGQAGVAAQFGEQPTVGYPGRRPAQLDGRPRVAAPGPGGQAGLELSGDDGVARRGHRQVCRPSRRTGRRSTGAGRAGGPARCRPPAGPGAWPCASAPTGPPLRPSRHRRPTGCPRRRRHSAPGGRRRAGRRYPSPPTTAGGPTRRWTPPERSPPEPTPSAGGLLPADGRHSSGAGSDDDVEGRLGPAQGQLDLRRRRASGEHEPQIPVALGQGDHRVDRRR